jgi:hypothetical protein
VPDEHPDGPGLPPGGELVRALDVRIVAPQGPDSAAEPGDGPSPSAITANG